MRGCQVAGIFILLFCSCSGYNGYILKNAADIMAKLGKSNEVKANDHYQKEKIDSVKAFMSAEANGKNEILYERAGKEKEDMAKINQITALRLVGGADSCEGRLELFAGGDFRQVCDLNFGDADARVLCSDLGCNSEGAQRVDPIQFGFSPAINLYVAFAVDCTGSESTVLDCASASAVCVTDSPPHAVALDCGGTSGQELRLVGGSNSCEGRLVTLSGGLYGQACDLNADNDVARVVCRQLGCSPVGAQRVDPVQFGFTTVIGRYHIFGEECSGSESNINQCTSVGGVCAADSIPHAIAISCGGSQINIQKILQGLHMAGN